MQDEMPGFFPGRPGGEHDEPLLDMIVARRPIPPGAPPEIHGLARMFAAVAGPAEPGDLPGQAAALAAFTRLTSPPHSHPDIRPSAPARRHPAALSDPVSDKAHPGPWHDHGRKGNGIGPGYASCVPMLPTGRDQGRAVGHSQNPALPSPAPNRVTSGSAQGPGGSGPAQDTPSPGFSLPGWLAVPTTACPPGTVPTKAAHARGR